MDIDMNPSSLVVGNEENPVEFEWTCEKGIGNQKVLDQFWSVHKLRPLKIIMQCGGDRGDLRFDQIMNSISAHYRIPIITIEEIINKGKSLLNGELLEDYLEEMPMIEEYLKNNVPLTLNEYLKLFYLVVKLRLS